jgi:hypothetical protein
MSARYYTGIDGALLIGGTQVAKVRNWSLTATADTIETTTTADYARTYVFGRQGWGGSCTALYYQDGDGALAIQPLLANTIRTTALPSSTTQTLKLQLTSDRAIEATVLITSAAITATAGDVVEVSVDFTVTGLLTEATMGAV